MTTNKKQSAMDIVRAKAREQGCIDMMRAQFHSLPKLKQRKVLAEINSLRKPLDLTKCV